MVNINRDDNNENNSNPKKLKGIDALNAVMNLLHMFNPGKHIDPEEASDRVYSRIRDFCDAHNDKPEAIPLETPELQLDKAAVAEVLHQNTTEICKGVPGDAEKALLAQFVGPMVNLMLAISRKTSATKGVSILVYGTLLLDLLTKAVDAAERGQEFKDILMYTRLRKELQQFLGAALQRMGTFYPMTPEDASDETKNEAKQQLFECFGTRITPLAPIRSLFVFARCPEISSPDMLMTMTDKEIENTRIEINLWYGTSISAAQKAVDKADPYKDDNHYVFCFQVSTLDILLRHNDEVFDTSIWARTHLRERRDEYLAKQK